VRVTINNKTWNYSEIKSNTLKVVDAFPIAGTYRITIDGTLADSTKRMIKADSFKVQIIKK
jgi:hypothetical protein